MKETIRVGFILLDSLKGWNGGINYYSNLFEILDETPGYKPVIICSPELRDIVENRFSNVEVRYYQCLKSRSKWDRIRRGIMYSTGYNIYIDRILRNNRIDIVTHNDCFPLNTRSKVVSCCWIPDFQSSYYPELFSQKHIRRERKVREFESRAAKYIIVSSEDARKDLNSYFEGKYDKKVRVLHFALQPSNIVSYENENVLAKYDIKPYSYFVISNQFWSHKNHTIVLKALDIIKNQLHNDNIKVIATGRLYDPRGMEYIEGLKDYIRDHDLCDSFVMTDGIPFQDVKCLQVYSCAVIQPSLFEGWNTSVEESKQIGKKILLSDIPVHREQNPENGIFFDPNSATELADLMIETLRDYDRKREEEYELRAKDNQYDVWEKYKQDYIKIIEDALS